MRRYAAVVCDYRGHPIGESRHYWRSIGFISVRDTGAGLAADQLAQLLQPFNRLGKELSMEQRPGNGLVVTMRLVELMRSIGPDSAVGVGAVFWIE